VDKVNLAFNITDGVLLRILAVHFEASTGSPFMVEMTQDGEGDAKIVKNIKLSDLVDIEDGIVLQVSRSLRDPGVLEILSSFYVKEKDEEEAAPPVEDEPARQVSGSVDIEKTEE